MFWANVINERTHNNRQRNYFAKNFYLKTQKLIPKSNSRNTNLARGSVQWASKIGWAHGKNYSTQISNQGAHANLKMYKTPKMKYIHKYINFQFENVILLTIGYKMYLKILQKLRCLVAFQNRPSVPIGRDENFVNFEFLERRFCKEKPSFFREKKTKHSFELFLPICVFKRCIFNLEMRNTGLVNPAHELSYFWRFCLGLTFSLRPRYGRAR